LELTLKAYWRGWRVEEVPTIWHDRTAGRSRFRLFAWLPHYLHWYFLALRTRAHQFWSRATPRTPRL
jgi:dolichol-phosphate mannosyltransferase